MSIKPDKEVADLWQRIYPQLVELLGEPRDPKTPDAATKHDTPGRK